MCDDVKEEYVKIVNGKVAPERYSVEALSFGDTLKNILANGDEIVHISALSKEIKLVEDLELPNS